MRLSRHYLATLLAAVLCSATTHAQVAGGDFNGDGRDDLAIGIFAEEVVAANDGPNYSGAGAVAVLYGSDSGLRAAGDQFWSQDSPGVGDQVDMHERFGAALAAGDFDNDGFTDLAIGVPGDRNDFATTGGVNVLYGSPAGLRPKGHQFFYRSSPGILGHAFTNEEFASALASADFDGDGFADLAIGVPGSIGTPEARAGDIHILYGGPNGLSAARDRIFHQGTAGIADASGNSDNFGAALAAADFNGDGFGDLAVGVPNESVGAVARAGAVNVLFGSASGLQAAGNQFWTQETPGIINTAENEDHFGAALAAGDFDDDGFADLAVGVPGENINSVPSAGLVHIIRGSAGGLTAAGSSLWHQQLFGIEGIDDETATFGAALTAADFDGDHFADLAVGIPRASPLSINRAGAVAVLYGSSAGIQAGGGEVFHQASADMQDGPEAFDNFGGAVGAGDFDGDGFADLAIGIGGEGINGVPRAGAVAVLRGRLGGLTTTGNQLWHQDQPGILDKCELTDYLGGPPS